MSSELRSEASYSFLCIVHQALVQLNKLSISDIPISLLHILIVKRKQANKNLKIGYCSVTYEWLIISLVTNKALTAFFLYHFLRWGGKNFCVLIMHLKCTKHFQGLLPSFPQSSLTCFGHVGSAIWDFRITYTWRIPDWERLVYSVIKRRNSI